MADNLGTKPGTMNDIRHYFGYDSAATFRQDWTKLSTQDKEDLKNGVGANQSGPMTY